MSDVSQGPGWWIATDGKWYAPELHPNYSPNPTTPPHNTAAHAAADTVDIGDSIPSNKAQRDGAQRDGAASRPIVLGLVVLIALGALGFVGFRLLSGGGSGAGAASPEGAVQGLIDSVNEADAVGLLAAFDPEEADAWVSSFSPLLRDLDLDVGVDVGGLGEDESTTQVEDTYATILSALAVAVTGPDGADPQYEVTTLVEGHLASVRVLGLDVGFAADTQPETTVVFGFEGDESVALDPTALAGLSLTMRDDGSGLLGTLTNANGAVEQDYAENVHLDLMTIERDGEWYISVGYTFLELARSQGEMNNLVLPDFGAALRSVENQEGAATAEDAVRELFTSIETLDVNKMISLVDPVAVPYLHDYAPLIDAEVDPAQRQDAAATLNLRIDELSLGQIEWEGRTVVTVESIAGGITDGGTFSFDFTTWCGQAQAQGDFIEGCADEAIQSGLNQLNDAETRAADLLPGDLGFVVEQRNGSWYVHPLATIGYLMHQSATTLQAFVERNADVLQADGFGSDVGTEPDAGLFAIEAPIAHADSPATSEPTNGVAAVAVSLADPRFASGVRDDAGVALFTLTTASPGSTSGGFGSRDIGAGQLWGLAVDTRGADQFELPAVSVATDGPITVEIVEVDPIVLDSDFNGSIGDDGRPVVFSVPATKTDVAVFGLPYRTLSPSDDGLAVLVPDPQSFGRISGGDFVAVFGEPGTEFEIFVF